MAAGTVAVARAAGPGLVQVAGFDQQVTGVAAAKNGQMFVTFLQWEGVGGEGCAAA